MTLEHEEIFNSFLGYVNDYSFVNLEEDDVNELMMEYLDKAVSKPYTRRLFSSFENDKDIGEISFEMAFKYEDEISDLDFVKDVLSKGMVVEWLAPKVRSVLNINQMFGGKEQKFYSQSQHLSEIRSLLEDTRLEQRKLIRDRGYINNSYLEDKLTW